MLQDPSRRTQHALQFCVRPLALVQRIGSGVDPAKVVCQERIESCDQGHKGRETRQS